ncbi:MAG: hypothetical protein JRK53_14020 [Deltaproteobacteria bacterium]|nr:hypothetical protein [Deltaproteobacteria bacterium]MBW1819138.1 hypothetical protein [Deltaproteobacteria bacterium]MBW2283076.1 hypothetical protein [Deltaproteobacteria bacterium]
MKRLLIVAATVLFVLPGLISCAGTRLTNVWKDDAYRGRPVSDVLVLGVTHEDVIRRAYENKFVEKLREAGVEAEPSFPLLAGDYRLKKEEIVAAMDKVGADSVIITHLVRMDEKDVYHPPQTYMVPRGGYHGYYGWAYDYVHRPGYSTVQVKVILDTSLYHAADEKPMWSARSETIDPRSEAQLMNDVIRAVVTDLKAKKLIAPKPKPQ